MALKNYESIGMPDGFEILDGCHEEYMKTKEKQELLARLREIEEEDKRRNESRF